MLKLPDLYIDLGTANTIIYGARKGFLLNEPSIVAIQKNSKGQHHVFGLGDAAKKMLGRIPQNISIIKPLNEGVISDSEVTSKMLSSFLSRIRSSLTLVKPQIIISLPCRVTEHERKAVIEVGLSLGARKVHLLDEPMAAAVGAGLPVLNSSGSMVVDIGGGTTEIAVISLGGIVTSAAVRMGSGKIDQLIIDHLRNKFNFLIGEQTAEFLKIKVANANRDAADSVEVGGFDHTQGLPRRVRITSSMIFEPVDSVLKVLIKAVKDTLERVPPEISGDIAERGLILAGGGALLNGLEERFAEELGIPIHLAPQPLLAVAFGGAKALEDRKLFDRISHVF